VLRPAVGDERAVVANHRVLVAKTRAADVDTACADLEHVVELRGHAVATKRLQHESLDTVFA
jgi:hypothetical protein